MFFGKWPPLFLLLVVLIFLLFFVCSVIFIVNGLSNFTVCMFDNMRDNTRARSYISWKCNKYLHNTILVSYSFIIL